MPRYKLMKQLQGIILIPSNTIRKIKKSYNKRKKNTMKNIKKKDRNREESIMYWIRKEKTKKTEKGMNKTETNIYNILQSTMHK